MKVSVSGFVGNLYNEKKRRNNNREHIVEFIAQLREVYQTEFVVIVVGMKVTIFSFLFNT